MESSQIPFLKRRPIKAYGWLFGALISVVIVGLLAILFCRNAYVYVFGISGFSIAYAIHFFSISIGLVGLFLRMEEKDKEKIRKIQEVEYEIVGCGLWILGGGLGILLSGGVLLLAGEYTPLKWLALMIYVVGGFILVYNVGRYQLSRKPEGLRAWPRKALQIQGSEIQERTAGEK